MVQERKISLFSTTGKIGKEAITSKASTFEELKKELTDMGIDLSNKSITEFTSKQDLAKSDILPEGDLRVYIMPAKVKSGHGEVQSN